MPSGLTLVVAWLSSKIINQRRDFDVGLWIHIIQLDYPSDKVHGVITNPDEYPMPPNMDGYPWVDLEVLGTPSQLTTIESLEHVKGLVLPNMSFEVRDGTMYSLKDGTYVCINLCNLPDSASSSSINEVSYALENANKS
ncbi:hypothetical protein RIF29_34115 [Crotalaria pallida]|uniref:Uncharacterized protein n=1 Tax=Crotalaria pallida TaxID=3830 RepID=A0AAN9E9U6_CROPI